MSDSIRSGASRGMCSECTAYSPRDIQSFICTPLVSAGHRTPSLALPLTCTRARRRGGPWLRRRPATRRPASRSDSRAEGQGVDRWWSRSLCAESTVVDRGGRVDGRLVACTKEGWCRQPISHGWWRSSAHLGVAVGLDVQHEGRVAREQGEGAGATDAEEKQKDKDEGRKVSSRRRNQTRRFSQSSSLSSCFIVVPE